MLPGVLEKHKLGYVRGSEITPSGRVCLQSHSGWGTCALAGEHRGRRGLIPRGLPSSVGSRHLRNRKEKQEGPYSCRSSPPANQATRLTFFFRRLKRSAKHLISPRRKIATSWGTLGRSAAAPQPQAPAAQGQAISQQPGRLSWPGTSRVCLRVPRDC